MNILKIPFLADTKEKDTAGPGDDLRENIIAALRRVFDPELPVNIYDLGLIYDIDIDPRGHVRIAMTLTSPACPVAGKLPLEVQVAVNAVPGVKMTQVELVWDPPWSAERMSEIARLEMGLL